MRPFRLRVMTAIALAILMLSLHGSAANAGLVPTRVFPEDPWNAMTVPALSFPEDPWGMFTNRFPEDPWAGEQN